MKFLGSHDKERVSFWISWVMQSVRGGHACVNVNGHRGEYVRTCRGLRQGTLSLLLFFFFVGTLLFNLVAEVLCSMMTRR
jgi:hypothetical protein